MSTITAQKDLFEEGPRKNVEYDDFTTSSILDFLNKERECFNADEGSEIDVESLFDEINRLSDNTDDRSVDEILREAEILINKQNFLSGCGGDKSDVENGFKKVVQVVHPDPVISEESIPKDMENSKVDEDSDRSDLIDESITLIRLPVDQDITSKEVEPTNECNANEQRQNTACSDSAKNLRTFDFEGIDVAQKILEDKSFTIKPENIVSKQFNSESNKSHCENLPKVQKLSSFNAEQIQEVTERKLFLTRDHKKQVNINECTEIQGKSPDLREKIRKLGKDEFLLSQNNVQSKRSSMQSEVVVPTQETYLPEYYHHKNRRASAEMPVTLNETFTRPGSVQSIAAEKSYCDKSTNSPPIRSVDANTSPIDNISITRERILKHEIEQLQEKLKDTEERLKSLRIQHDSVSQLHRDLRENHTHTQEESELLKLDVQHLTECANILRSELQSARNDRNEALEVQKILHTELEESRREKKKAQEQREKDAKTIQDLQRQCREMERILVRKHPDSVSALIVASKHPSKSSEDNSASRRLLEQRIAQLESDAKEQDLKAQKILANVQARFNSVQSKYETHIADLETQVLSLQEINTKLNEKIESQILVLNNFARNNKVNHFTQTDDIAERESTPTSTTSTQTDSTSRPNSSQRQTPPIKKSSSKMPSSHSDTTISAYHAAAKEDAHLLATIRGMRVDLAIKDKAMQRLTRELEECKKTIKKLQKERDAMRSEKPSSASSSSSSRKLYDPNQYADQSSDSQALKEALNKIKLLEFDYKALHDKRLQDLKTLQAAHERELASCHETVRILQQRLTERDEAFNTQKRRKVPIDYYALKAKVSSLERRHSEREQRLHMLVEALSKGRLNGALEEILTDNNQ